MGSGLPPPSISAVTIGKKRRTKWGLLTIFLATCALLLNTSQLNKLGAHTHQHVVPINAQEILSECAALYTTPRNSRATASLGRLILTLSCFQGPPSNFGERVESDRYEPGALPTLITNATIWTGNKSGREVILGGEIFLDKGIIKYVGDRAPDGLVSNNR
jgi:hypothetical protein